MHNIVDKMIELSAECCETRPAVADLLSNIALDFGTLVNDLMYGSGIRMCPENLSKDKNGEMVGVHTYFDGSSIYKKDKKI